ncbi:PREDICTED: protein NDR1-like [Nelumbo nucifera]|uniref:Protein NDR1-like n=2 Tax=Nelumbo nucifera TaxID=4432 RepID=A0A1U8AX44_NELNU|nr:PREDICTED: protein NDR1-like [Nelumbo nucifera]DAD23267.1 TPA_asm: hypothetical protein HUJ06_024730 [Nelumbo nucifera]
MCETNSFRLWLIQVVVLSGLLALVLWLALRPKNLTYTVISFSLPATSPVDPGDAQNSAISFDLEIENPNNGYGIYYNGINMTLYYNDDILGETFLPDFYQGKGKTKKISQSINADGRFLKKIFTAISNATAETRLGLATRIRFKSWTGKTKPHGMQLQGRIPVGSDGKIAGKKKIKLQHVSRKWKLRKSYSLHQYQS